MPQISTTSQILASLPSSSSSPSPSASPSSPSPSSSSPSTSTTQQAAFPGQDCLACKLVGSGAFTGLGLYSIYQAHTQGAFRRYRPAGSPVVSGQITAVLGTIFLGLGIGRLFI